MRTAVIRVGVDPAGELDGPGLLAGAAALRGLAAAAGADVLDNLAEQPVPSPRRREVQVLLRGDDAEALLRTAVAMCAEAFGTVPAPGVVTFVSRGTDDDAHGVLAGFGITGDIERTAGADGWDIVEVTLAKVDLERIPESRIHTALEASLNSEVRIVVR